MALRRRPAAPSLSAPSFSLQLPTAESSAQLPVKLDEPVNRRLAEQLIVAVDGAPVDSPFIAMEGQFPGTTADAHGAHHIHHHEAAMLNRSRSESGSFDDMTAMSTRTGSADGYNLDHQSHGTTAADHTANAAAAAAAMHSQRKFFRVDSSNVYVLMNPNLTESDVFAGGGAKEQLPLITSNEDEATIPFDDLEIGDVLGSGSQGTVRAVAHRGRQYALKRISISQALDKTQADVERQARKNAIVRELQMLAQKTHRHGHLVALHNGYFRKDSDEGVLHILMERMGMSVEALHIAASHIPPAQLRASAQRIFGNYWGGNTKIPSGQAMYNGMDDAMLEVRLTPLPEIVVAMIAHDALKGLDHFHSHLRFVHTDIKPANLMFDMNLEVVKVADFGCSQQLPRERGVSVNVTNVTLGTKLYMSPERASAAFGGASSGFSEATDVWSLGVSLLELASGVHPCHPFRENYWDFAEYLDLAHLVPPEQCSSLFWDFMSRCLVTKYEERPSAAELLEHDFIKKYAAVPRKRLKTFLQAVKTESAKFEQKKLLKTVEHQLSVATKTKDRDPRKHNMRAWQSFQKGIMGNVPRLDDPSTFPTL